MRLDEHLLKSNNLLKFVEKHGMEILPKKSQIYCKSNQISDDLLRCLTAYDLSQALNDYFGCPTGLYEMNDLLGVSHVNPIQEKLLIVGSNDSGDPFAIDLNTGEVGYLSHDEIDQAQTAREVFAVISVSLGEFCKTALDGGPIPIDYYDTKARINK